MTYGEMAAALGVTRCRGRTSTGHYCTHVHDRQGSITDDTVHFSERRVKRPDTLALLKLVARIQDPSLDHDVPWRRVYRMNLKVRSYASFLGIPDPAYPSHGDRAFVLASVASIPNSEPMRKQAFDWARRGPKREE